MIMMIPMLILIIRFFGARIRNWILLLSILCALTFFYQLSYNPDILLRGVLMGFSLSAFALFLWLYLKRPLMNEVSRNWIYRILRVMLLTFMVLLLIAVFANLAGAFSLAEFFTIIPIQIVLLAFGVVVAINIADTLIYLALGSNLIQKVNIVRDDFNYIYKKAGTLANLLLWGLFFVISLNIFRIKDAVFQWINGLFTNGIKVGDAEITLGSILIFIFVIWISIVVSRIIRHVLEKDVFPRVETAKGVPSTVTLFLRIILISSGFFLAAAAAGIKLSNLSIVLGAFSVGIGFGLQNIFNNMVSGLILALERPIKVGDVVQVGELIGSVRSIGLRSSNVKSFDGAEVIVPNGNLISTEMINWTLSDSNRRMDIRIGVAYGSDTDAVIKLLQEIALDHPEVYKIPPPTAYFTGFGDSALDFRLLAWTNIDKRLAVESDLNGAINKALKKARIEIPFPQRDLHIRS
jgi:small-conductance mechanosensitive channel